VSQQRPDLGPALALLAALVLFAFLLDSALDWLLRRTL
jgi:hypothetical protein